MPYFDHTIAPSTDEERSARFLSEMLGAGEVRTEGPFRAVDLGNDVTFYFAGWDEGEVARQHYCFRVTEEEFDGVLARLEERGLTHWADPEARRPDEVNHDDGGRGMYFRDPDGHWLEVLTVRYGGRPARLS